MRVPTLHAAGALAALLGTACAGRQSLPVQHVVVYRNGIAYFERSGHVDQDEARFTMKKSSVGDFLATLAVMERGGSSVRAAGFPVRQEDGDDSRGDGSQTVVLALDGKSHDLRVGYIAESPVWRPSYRIVVRQGGKADLQVWGIVQNLSGEDWKDVSLSLATGAPLAFQANLGATVIPSRPVVTDSGQTIGAIPHGETVLSQEEMAQREFNLAAEAKKDIRNREISSAQSMHPQQSGDPLRDSLQRQGGGYTTQSEQQYNSSSRTPPGHVAGTPLPMPNYPPPSAAGTPASPAMDLSPPRDARSLAAVTVDGASTRYDLPQAITIRDKSATMVMVLARSVPGEALYLFAPDGNVPDSATHPFRVAHFKNETGGTLEPGPITMFEEGAFLGQGLLDTVPSTATATVPFALEGGIAVVREQKSDEVGERVAKIENGELTIERDKVMLTTYRVRNGGEEAAKVLMRHARVPQSRLSSPPPGTEDNVGTGTALVPTTVAAHSTTDLTVDERVAYRKAEDWYAPVADSAVKAYLADPKSDREVAQKLKSVWVIRDEYVKKFKERASLKQQAFTASQETEEARRDLKSTERGGGVDTLRQKLAGHLTEASARMAELNRKIADLDATLAGLNTRFDAFVHDIVLTVPTANL